ncbi:MAG: glycosyl transferase [Verrucomicrobia bacterium RIFCSPHIGHO2_12_FULL_41_10]|nr:MAG: glycosyl transferase [Verrucomicrobia bacterium RIFCSPHIGHO2_12_FULL_41_10]
MKTALVYDWFAELPGGGEKAFEAIYSLFPSPIYTLLYSQNSIQGTTYEHETFHSSFIQKFPQSLKRYRSYLPFYPLAIEQFDLSSYDLILSCSHCVAKGVLTHAEQTHLCYCYTPMRYAWDLYHQYLQEAKFLKGIKGRLAQFFLHYLRMWDLQSSPRVDAFGAVSHYVAKRIQKTYGRTSTVIYPPVDTDFYKMGSKKEEFYLTASRMVPYKKMDLIVEAFSQMPDKRLVVIGDGPEMEKIKAKATKNIELIGYQSNEVLKETMQKAKAFLFAAIEDFGIVPVEAQGCGTPVIAYGKGALLETVIPEKTGLFFDEQTALSLICAVKRFEAIQDHFDAATIRAHAETFSRIRFQEQFCNWVKECTS